MGMRHGSVTDDVWMRHGCGKNDVDLTGRFGVLAKLLSWKKLLPFILRRPSGRPRVAPYTRASKENNRKYLILLE